MIQPALGFLRANQVVGIAELIGSGLDFLSSGPLAGLSGALFTSPPLARHLLQSPPFAAQLRRQRGIFPIEFLIANGKQNLVEHDYKPIEINPLGTNIWLRL